MPPKSVDVCHAKTHFSRLLARVARGESITITRHGTPVARLAPAASSPVPLGKDKLLARFKAFARRHRTSGAILKSMREEGRR